LFLVCLFHLAAKEKKSKGDDDEDEHADPSQYFENRVREIEELSKAGKPMYPRQFFLLRFEVTTPERGQCERAYWDSLIVSRSCLLLRCVQTSSTRR
jgi:hypothetical protein